MRLLRDLGRGAAAGADRPDGLVGDRDLQHLRAARGRRARRRAACVRRRSVSPPSRSASLSPMQSTGSSPARERRRELARERLVRLAEERAALGVAEQHAGRAGVDQHAARDLAREGALGGVVDVLAPDADAGVADALGDDVERGERRADGEVDLVELVDERQERAAEVGRLRARLEHLPVAGHERRALHQDSSGGNRGHARQDVALEQLEAGAAAGRDVIDAVGEAGLRDGRDRVAAADDGVARAGGDRLGHGARAGGERRELEGAHRAVPEHGARPGDALARTPPSVCGPMSRPIQPGWIHANGCTWTSVSAENARPATTSTGSASSQPCCARRPPARAAPRPAPPRPRAASRRSRGRRPPRT